MVYLLFTSHGTIAFINVPWAVLKLNEFSLFKLPSPINLWHIFWSNFKAKKLNVQTFFPVDSETFLVDILEEHILEEVDPKCKPEPEEELFGSHWFSI